MQPPDPRPSPHGRAPRVGILGAGQLAFLLCRAGRDLGIRTLVVAQRADEPATAAADDVLVGDLDEPTLARRFLAGTDFATFDKEAIPAAMLDRLAAAERAGDVIVRPGTGVLRLLQNKSTQKEWLVRNGLPALPGLRLTGNEANFVDRVAAFGLPCVQKTQKGGYDGKGVQVIADHDQLDKLWRVPSVFEPFLEQRVEIAVVVARGAGGQTRCYAPVAMQFTDELNILSQVQAPAELPGGLVSEARAIATRTVHALNSIGVFCIEMFLTPTRELLINEISPRVHNAAHHTLEANATSQFEQHLRAITGMPLGPVSSRGAAVMQNLLYTPALANLAGLGPGLLPQRHQGVHAWWYGKAEMRPWRKVGHVTAVAKDFATAKVQLAAAVADLENDRASAA